MSTRKLVKQGNGGLTICLPKEWIVSQKLSAGDEVTFSIQEHVLYLSNFNKESKKKITLTFSTLDESLIRTEITNAYRGGYDLIECFFEEDISDILLDVSSNYILGFDIFEKTSTSLILENIFTSETQNFDHIVSKFFIIGDLLFDHLFKEDISKYTTHLEKYSNFFKRMIISGNFSIQKNYFFWSFITELTHIARMCKYVQVGIDFKLFEKNAILLEIHKNLQLMYSLLKSAYLKNNSSDLAQIAELHRTIVFTMPDSYYREVSPKLLSQLIVIARLLYLATSPLKGFLQNNILRK